MERTGAGAKPDHRKAGSRWRMLSTMVCMLLLLPLASPADALTLLGAVSRKVHGTAGAVDLRIDHTQPIGGNVTIDPRAIGGGHRIVFQFDGPVTHPGVVVARDERNLVLVGVSVAVQGQEVAVTLPQLADRKRVHVELLGVSGTSLNVSAAVGFVVGDVDSSRAVADSDLTAARTRSGRADEPVLAFDLNTTGVVTAADIAAVKMRRGGALASAVAPTPPSFSTIVLDPMVPAGIAGQVSRVITPLGTGAPGASLATNAASGTNSIAVAVDAGGNMWLGTVEVGPNTQLGAESTALLLARLALGPLEPGQTPAQVNTAIRNAMDFALLRQAVSDALTLGIVPASHDPVREHVQTVAAQAAASLNASSSMAAPQDATSKRAGAEASISTSNADDRPCMASPLGFEYVTLPVPCALIPIRGSGYNRVRLIGGGGEIKNYMPIHWVVQALDASGTPYPVPMAGVETELPPASLFSKPEVSLPVPLGHGFRVVLKQTNDTRVKNLGSLIEGVVNMLVDQLAPSNLRAERCLASIATKIFTAEQLETLVLVDNPDALWRHVENVGLTGIAQAVVDCYAEQEFKFELDLVLDLLGTFGKSWSTLLVGASKLYDGYTLYEKAKHTFGFLNGRAEATVCRSKTFFGAAFAVECPVEFAFDGGPVILAEGAGVAVGPAGRAITIKAFDESGNPTAVPENLVITPQAPTALEWRYGSEVAALPNPAPVGSSVFPISTGMTFSYPLTEAAATLPVDVVRPVISPANTVVYQNEYATLRLVDHLNRPVSVSGSGIQWVISNEGIADINGLYSVFGQSAVQVRGVSPGTTTVALYNSTSGLTSGATATMPATIEVRPPRGYWQISYTISECGFVEPIVSNYSWYFGDPCSIGTPVDGSGDRYFFFDDETDDVVFQSRVSNAGNVRTVMQRAFRSTQNTFTWSTGAGISLDYSIPYSGGEIGVATVSGTRSYVFNVISRTPTSMQGTFRIDGVGARWQYNGTAPSGDSGPTYSIGNWTGTFIPGQRPQTKLFGDYFCFTNNSSMPQMVFPTGPGNPRLMPGWINSEGLVPTGCIYG